MTPVIGVVLFKGVPLPGAVVRFHQDKMPILASGTTDEEGRFVLGSYGKDDGAPLGVNTVTVYKPIDPPSDDQIASNLEELQSIEDPAERRKRAAAMQGDKIARTQARTRLRRKLSIIPTRYMDPETSDLRATVKPQEENTFRFELVP